MHARGCVADNECQQQGEREISRVQLHAALVSVSYLGLTTRLLRVPENPRLNCQRFPVGLVNANPCRDFLPAAIQVFIQLFIGRLIITHQVPKALRMIHVPCVTKLMDHHITKMRRIQKHQAIIQTESTGTRVTAPAGSLPANVHLFERVPGKRR